MNYNIRSQFVPTVEQEKLILSGYLLPSKINKDGIVRDIRDTIAELGIQGEWHIARTAKIGALYTNCQMEEFLKAKSTPYSYLIDRDSAFMMFNRHGEGKPLFLQDGGLHFVYQGHSYYVFKTRDITENLIWTYIACQDFAVLQEFVTEIESFTPEKLNGKLMVYRSKWVEDTDEIYQDIKKYTWDDLFLKQEVKDDIKHNVSSFFSPWGRDIYDTLGIPFKRGLLFVGEPGSGKSLTAKIIASTTENIPFFYITDIKTSHMADADVFTMIFETARRYAPSILCFEDLDTLVTAATRSHFLGLMDGFEENSGVLTIATTNFPDKIDPALVNRPSRFDRKYLFSTPDEDSRLQYLIKRFMTLTKYGIDVDSLNVTLKKVAKQTYGFSVAMLQELVISSAHSWLSERTKNTSWETVILQAVHDTREQTKAGIGAKLFDEMTITAKAGFRQK